MIITTAIFLPGNMCDARMWGCNGGVIEQALRDRGMTVLHADLSEATTIAEMAANTLALVEGQLMLIGFSMGGIVAVEMARIAPERIIGMVLADTNCGADKPERAAARPAQQERVRHGQLAEIVITDIKPAYLGKCNRDAAALKSLVFDMAIDLGETVFCAQSEALRTRGDNCAALAAFKGPTLFMAGAEDALCPPALHREMAASVDCATLHIIDGAGHMLPLEQPVAFSRALAAWLDAHQGDLFA